MTAPAEDPRGGEARPVCNESWTGAWGDHCIHPHGHDGSHMAAGGHAWLGVPPAAGRGDTDSGGECVTVAEIVRQRGLGWPDFHPEDHCHRCGRPNPNWFADTAEWQTATGSTGDGGGILCPSCFCALWEKVTGKTAIIWRLSIDPRSRDARPAGDRAQPTKELREAIARASYEDQQDAYIDPPWDVLGKEHPIRRAHEHLADAVLALPAVAALLDAQAAVNRVEALAAEYAERAEKVADGFWKRHLWIVSQRLRRALDGTT